MPLTDLAHFHKDDSNRSNGILIVQMFDMPRRFARRTFIQVILLCAIHSDIFPTCLVLRNKGDFHEASLLSDGVEVVSTSPIEKFCGRPSSIDSHESFVST